MTFGFSPLNVDIFVGFPVRFVWLRWVPIIDGLLRSLYNFASNSPLKH